MKKCTTKPGQNYPRVLTFTTNTPERGLHLLEYKEFWTPAQNLPEQSTKKSIYGLGLLRAHLPTDLEDSFRSRQTLPTVES